jgi:hypothetical protein
MSYWRGTRWDSYLLSVPGCGRVLDLHAAAEPLLNPVSLTSAVSPLGGTWLCTDLCYLDR